MLGTLSGALEVREIRLKPGDIRAEVSGTAEMREGLPVLTAIDIGYRLRIPAGSRLAVERALARHQEKCPTAASLKAAIVIRWTADIAEALDQPETGGRTAGP
jgi:hypothetical protein